MTCSRTPQLTELDILMALDGEGDPEMALHIAHCPTCRLHADQLIKLQDQLGRRLHRADCPSSLEAGEYQLGLLPAARATIVRQHLAVCPLCSAEQAQLASFLKDGGPMPRTDLLAPVRESMRVLVARLTSGFSGGGLLGQPALAPALAGLRGAAEGPLVYEVDGMQVMAEVADDADHPGRKSILGLLTGTFPADCFQAYLWQAATYRATTAVDSLGNFTLDDLAPGDYSLVLSGPDVEIHLENLPVAAH